MRGVHSAWIILGVMLLAGCGRQTPIPETLPTTAPPPFSAEAIEELARDPERLEEVRQLCREDRQRISETLCAASAQALRKRFMSERKARYAPGSVALPQAQRAAAKNG